MLQDQARGVVIDRRRVVGAAVIGLAVGFGSQELVRDVISPFIAIT